MCQISYLIVSVHVFKQLSLGCKNIFGTWLDRN